MATAADLDIKMDAASLYREEIYTDRRIGTIRAMVPVTASGDADKARETLYIGEAQIMTQMGPLPVTFEIEAASLDAAVDRLRQGRQGRGRTHGQRIAGAAPAERLVVGITGSGRQQLWSGRIGRIGGLGVAARFKCPDADEPGVKRIAGCHGQHRCFCCTLRTYENRDRSSVQLSEVVRLQVQSQWKVVRRRRGEQTPADEVRLSCEGRPDHFHGVVRRARRERKQHQWQALFGSVRGLCTCRKRHLVQAELSRLRAANPNRR